LVSLFIASLLAKKGDTDFTSKLENDVLLIDTEQGRRRTNGVVRRIYRLLNLDFETQIPNFTAISIRELSANERFLVLEKAVKEHSFSIIFLDGFADLIQNTNDLEECSRKVSQLMKLSEDSNTHICSVVHTNPNSDKTRGHIGSELQRKCETVLLVKKDDEISTVSPQFCKNKEFKPFKFFVNPAGLPELCTLSLLDVELQQVFTSIFDGSSQIAYTDLCQLLIEKENIVKRTAERKIKKAIDMNILRKTDVGNYSISR
jgi:hypothetical protein